jgi:hypothetical protein
MCLGQRRIDKEGVRGKLPPAHFRLEVSSRLCAAAARVRRVPRRSSETRQDKTANQDSGERGKKWLVDFCRLVIGSG